MIVIVMIVIVIVVVVVVVVVVEVVVAMVISDTSAYGWSNIENIDIFPHVWPQEQLPLNDSVRRILASMYHLRLDEVRMGRAGQW